MIAKLRAIGGNHFGKWDVDKELIAPPFKFTQYPVTTVAIRRSMWTKMTDGVGTTWKYEIPYPVDSVTMEFVKIQTTCGEITQLTAILDYPSSTMHKNLQFGWKVGAVQIFCNEKPDCLVIAKVWLDPRRTFTPKPILS